MQYSSTEVIQIDSKYCEKSELWGVLDAQKCQTSSCSPLAQILPDISKNHPEYFKNHPLFLTSLDRRMRKSFLHFSWQAVQVPVQGWKEGQRENCFSHPFQVKHFKMYSKQLLITARMLVLLHALRRKEKALTGPSHLWARSATEQPLNGRNAQRHSPRPLVRAVLTSHIATPRVSSHSSFPTALPLGCSGWSSCCTPQGWARGKRQAPPLLFVPWEPFSSIVLGSEAPVLSCISHLRKPSRACQVLQGFLSKLGQAEKFYILLTINLKATQTFIPLSAQVWVFHDIQPTGLEFSIWGFITKS